MGQEAARLFVSVRHTACSLICRLARVGGAHRRAQVAETLAQFLDEVGRYDVPDPALASANYFRQLFPRTMDRYVSIALSRSEALKLC